MVKKVNILPELLDTNAMEWRFDITLSDSDALIITTFGSGSLPSRYTEKIRQSVRDGRPVFLLVNTEKTSGIAGEKSAGILGVTYGTQQDVLEAGAVHLESVNMGHFKRSMAGESSRPKDNVLKMITDLAQGTDDMFELIKRVRETYNLTDEEIEPLVEASQSESAPITREKILKSRQLLDGVLSKIESDRDAERSRELKPVTKLKR